MRKHKHRQFKIGMDVRELGGDLAGTIITNLKEPDENGNNCILETFRNPFTGERKVFRVCSADFYPYFWDRPMDECYIDEKDEDEST